MNPFPYPLKTSEIRKIFCCFQGVEKGYPRNEWVKNTFLSVIAFINKELCRALRSANNRILSRSFNPLTLFVTLNFKVAMEFYFIHYSCMVIILFIMDILSLHFLPNLFLLTSFLFFGVLCLFSVRLWIQRHFHQLFITFL